VNKLFGVYISKNYFLKKLAIFEKVLEPRSGPERCEKLDPLPVPGSLNKKGGKKVPSCMKQKVASSSAFFV
jgi:hypothetical protein